MALTKRKPRTARSHGLKRPKTPLSYNAPTIPPTTSSSAATSKQTPLQSSSTPTPSHRLNQLSNPIHILTLLLRRNKNQHRAQPFFKLASLLRKALRQLLQLETSLVELARSAVVLGGISADSVRRRFEREAALRSRREVVERYIREVLVGRCWVVFGGVVGDTQFAAVGLVLVAVLGEVGGLVGLPSGDGDGDRAVGERASERGNGGAKEGVAVGSLSLLGRSTRMTGEDQGEVVERVYDSGDAVERSRSVGTRDGESRRERQMVEESEGREVLNPGYDSVGDLTSSGNADSGAKNEQRRVRTEDRDQKSKVKKRKKGKDAIDDLFSGLV